MFDFDVVIAYGQRKLFAVKSRLDGHFSTFFTPFLLALDSHTHRHTLTYTNIHIQYRIWFAKHVTHLASGHAVRELVLKRII